MSQYEVKEEGAISEWNEAMFKMKRLHELQTEINRVKMDLLSMHLITKKWNYEIWIDLIWALYSEGDSKYNNDEKKECHGIKELIDDAVNKLPIFKTSKVEMYGRRCQIQKSVIKENWLTLKKLIEVLEHKVKYYNDKHGLSTKNVDNMDGRSILR